MKYFYCFEVNQLAIRVISFNDVILNDTSKHGNEAKEYILNLHKLALVQIEVDNRMKN